MQAGRFQLTETGRPWRSDPPNTHDPDEAPSHLMTPDIDQSSRRKWLEFLLFLAFFLSGTAGLAYQVVWARYFGLFIGGTSYAHTIVLGTFMGGLALGNAIFGRVADRISNRLLLYGLLEVGIGVTCLIFPWFFGQLTTVYLPAAESVGFGSPVTLWLKLALCAVSILAPTVMMGGTLPVVVRHIVADMAELGHQIGKLYFVNTFGAMFGTLLCGFVLIAKFGLDATMYVGAAFNLAIGLFFLAAAVTNKSISAPQNTDEASPSGDNAATERPAADGSYLNADYVYDRGRVRITLWCIAISGAVSMSYEVIWTRVVSLVLGSSTHSFTMMLVTFIGGIAAGGVAASRMMTADATSRIAGAEPMRLFGLAQLGIAFFVAILIPMVEQLPFAFNVLSSVFQRQPEVYPMYLAVQLVVCVALMLAPTVLIGTTLPLASRIAVSSAERSGTGVGNAFSVNTAGTLTGAVVTGLFVVPWLGLQLSLELCVVTNLVLGLILLNFAPGTSKKRSLNVAIAGVCGAAAFILLMPKWDPSVLHAGLYRQKEWVATDFDTLKQSRQRMEVLFHKDGANTSVAVMKHKVTGTLYMTVNGKTDAGTGNDMTTQLWLGHLGMFLHPNPQKVAVIGLGSGITAGAALTHPRATVDQIEISQAVVDGSAYFAPYNNNITANPRYRLHVGDAKEFFKLNPDKQYDIIVSEPSNPWIAGVGNLFTYEYFEEAKAHLTSDGIMVQWVHLYDMSDEVLRIVLDTFAASFPEVTIWQCNSADVLVLGSRAKLKLDEAKMARTLAIGEVYADLNRPGLAEQIRSPLQILSMQMLDETTFRQTFAGRPPLNLDRVPLLEYSAPRAFFEGAEATWLRELDARRLPLSHSSLLLAQRMREKPLLPNENKLLLDHHRSRGSAYDLPLVRSLIATMLAQAPSDAALQRERLAEGTDGPDRLRRWRDAAFHAGPTSLWWENRQFVRDALDALEGWGGIYGSGGSPPPELEAAMTRLAATAPNEAAPLLFVAIDVLLRTNQPSLAYVSGKLLRQAIVDHGVRPNDLSMAEIWYRIGIAAWKTNHHTEAQHAFREALNNEPEHLRTQQQLYLLGSQRLE